MPIGDDALAAGMTILDGSEDANDIDTYINETRDFIAQRTYAIQPVAAGGTGAADAAGARANLSVPSLAEHATKADNGHTHSALYYPGASFFWKPAPFNEWNTASGNLYVGGFLTVQGAIFNPSSRRLKEDITPAPVLGDIFQPLKEYTRVDGGGSRELGYLAEDLVGTDAERFVKFDADGEPQAINYLSLLVAQVAQLQARVLELEARE